MSSIIGTRIKRAREALNLTQEEVAGRLGIGRPALSNIENGRNLVRLEHIPKLVRVLNRPIGYFFGIVGDLTADEEQLLEVYRALPGKRLKSTAIDIIQSLVSYSEQNHK